MKPRLFLQVMLLEMRKLMSYRTDFWLQAVATFVVHLTVAYFLWVAIFAASGRARIGGFTLEQMILYYVLVLLLAKLVRGREHHLPIAEEIYQGGLTRFLLYPSSYFGFKYAESLGALLPAVMQLLLFGALSVTVLDLSGLGEITALSLLKTLVSLAVANLMTFLIAYTVQATAFWADNIWSLNVMLGFISSLLGGHMLPLSLFPQAVQPVLAALPFQYQYYFPVMTLTDRVSHGQWLQGMAIALAWCVLLAAVSQTIWRRGYRVYTGVGI